jgi:UDP-N-acetylenolpyruvoylglucosamine reductase
MIAFCLDRLGLDPAYLIGGEVPQLDGNARAGSGWLVAEGDESDRTLELLHPRIAAVTNVELDHHATFASEDELRGLFEQWLAGVPAVVRGEKLEPAGLELAVPGEHNRRNAAVALAALELAGVERVDAERVLPEFRGVGRRFESRGEAGGVRVYDDYGHNPTKVAAALEAARAVANGGRVLVLFQPHLYSRTRHSARELAVALATADAVAVSDVYAAREEPQPGVDGKLVVDALATRRPGDGRGVDAERGGRRPFSLATRPPRRSRPRRRRGRRRPGGSADPGGADVKIEEGVALSRFTTIGTGGPAKAFARPETLAELEEALAWARERGLAIATVGLGSNLLVADDGFDGLVLKLAGELAAAEVDGELLVAGGGAANAVCLHRARAAGLGGFEFACAIPGTVGGGVWMNAGAYGSDWAAILVRALVVNGEGAHWLSHDELGLSYRHSSLHHGQVVAGVEFRLEPRPEKEIKAKVAELQALRKAAQPTNKRTFGSVFKNPDHELSAGRMLEACGLKGHRIGGAQISPRHANFIENADGARSADAIALMAEARRRALEQFGVELEHEVEFLEPLELPPLR